MVYVLSVNGKPLMPCKEAKARHLLKENKAAVVSREPFTIKLNFECDNQVQPVTLGVDAGAVHIGLSASTEKAELYSCEIVLRTDITDLISTRREMRRARRNRKTRYRKPRFLNRVKAKKKGWLAPSVMQKINAHLKVVDNACKILPITKIVVETASFDIQKIKNPEINGIEYQQGEQLNFWNVREYVLWRDNHTCQHCHGKSKDNILNVHHLESRKTGGNAPNNLITLCETCHKKYHEGKIKLKQKRGQSFKAEAFMGIMRWAFWDKLKSIYPTLDIKNTYGYITKNTRIRLGLPKAHNIDAYCIAGNVQAERLNYFLYQKQVRKHNRQIHKMTTNKGGTRKRNQAPFEMHGFRLFDKVKCKSGKYKGKDLKGEIGFVFARRTDGYFYVRKLDGSIISPCVNFKHLQLLSKRKTYLTTKIFQD
jgi:N6-L-threonylcarbamoyladenine synthase